MVISQISYKKFAKIVLESFPSVIAWYDFMDPKLCVMYMLYCNTTIKSTAQKCNGSYTCHRLGKQLVHFQSHLLIIDVVLFPLALLQQVNDPTLLTQDSSAEQL